MVTPNYRQELKMFRIECRECHSTTDLILDQRPVDAAKAFVEYHDKNCGEGYRKPRPFDPIIR